MFIALSTYLIFKLYKGQGEIGILALTMSLLAVLNGISAIVRVTSAFPIFTNDVRGHSLIIAYCLEYLGEFGAQWLFTIKYYEAAEDLKLMLQDCNPNARRSKAGSLTSQLSKRKNRYRCIRWTVFLVLTICLAAVAIILCVTTETEKTFVIIIGAAYGILTVFEIAVGVLMVLALRTFVKVVNNSSSREGLNHWFVWMQVICVLLLGAIWFS